MMSRGGVSLPFVLFCVVSCMKVLLVPCYFSTDFDVHRNWLALTHSRPLALWYWESTSQWTLDYPPLFGYLEWLLSVVASLVDDGALLQVTSEPYRSYTARIFQRFSVMATDALFFGALLAYTKAGKENQEGKDKQQELSRVLVCGLLLFNPGLLMLDHVHFQYNGILFGVLIYSLAMIQSNNYIGAAICYSVLLNMKHLFLYVAPVYFVYLLRSYCFNAKGDFSIWRLAKLSVTTLVVFTVSFGPFLWMGMDQLRQILSRLFPFQRGLCHAYWAPNFWSLYNVVDKILKMGTKLSGKMVEGEQVATMTGGLVGTASHEMLPTIYPHYTNILIVIAILPLCFRLWKKPKPTVFLASLVQCALTFFMFGWHVHEKAILTAIIPLWLLVLHDTSYSAWAFFLSVVGHYSLFPLLFEPREVILRNLLLTTHIVGSYICLNILQRSCVRWRGFLLKNYEWLYLFGLIPVEVFSIMQPLLVSHLPFLPLMMTSFYCGTGVVYVYISLYAKLLQASDDNDRAIDLVKQGW